MRWARDLRRAAERVDVRLTLLLAGVTAAFTSSLLCGLLAYAVNEALEEQAVLLDDSMALVAAAPSGAGIAPAHRGVAYRVLADGREVAAAGRWPREDESRHESVRTALAASASEYLVREKRLADGRVIAAALPLRHFVRERGELTHRAVAVVLLGICGALGLGFLGARLALRPLRDTTAAIDAIDPRRLAARIPVRGTADDLDRLAAATNDVLARLEWAFRTLSAFSADAAHELRTPVNRILNAAEIALTTTDDPAAKDDALAQIQASAEAMRRTIEQLLLLARAEDGRLEIVREPVDLGTLVGGLLELYAPAAERLGKMLALEPTALAVHADRDLVERAVANLLENALRHTPGGATIRLHLEAPDGKAVVVVEDSGPGIAVSDRERIFTRFVRLDEARAPGGAGLGLPIARMIARLHGGDVEVRESTLGGAAFRFAIAA